jgi:serpin B
MRLLGLALATILAAGACSGANPSVTSPRVALARSDVARAAVDPATAAVAADALERFGLALYERLAKGGNGAIVVSPASIALALAMARTGARGETAAQMDAVLGGLGSDATAAALNALDQALASRSGTFKAHDDKPYELTLGIANAPFAQRDTKWEQAFLDALASRYGAGVRLVDFKADAEGARKQINAWVDEQTRDRIPELLAPGLLDALVRLVLVNAIYLKAPWETPFAVEATRDGAFHRLDGMSVTVPMMSLSEELPYARGDGWQVVELPYVGGSLALDVIVPDDLRAFEGAAATLVPAATAALSDRHVDLELPRFKAETKVDLAELLPIMGMPLAFDPERAEFSGMTTAEQLYISNVVHQANITVDEKGTEAAAATAVVMRTTAMPAEPVRLVVDRPFLFALRDVPTGAILFLGRIVDPSAG